MEYVVAVASTVQLPESAWHRAEVRDALVARDIPALLRHAQAHTGASQGRLAAAFGMTQGRVNELVNRRRARAHTGASVFVGTFDALREGHHSPVYRLPRRVDGTLYRAYTAVVDQLLEDSEQII